MEWRDQGILLSSRRHGESGAIIDVFTPTRGRHAGIVHGGAGRKLAPILQPGAQLDVEWRARLENQLGTFRVESIRSRAAVSLSDRMALAGLNAVTALLMFTLPERETHKNLYHQTEALLDLLGQNEIWPLAYLKWEMALLDDMGFGLDLTQCAVTGGNDRLAYVSPRTGRAVSLSGAGEWVDRLLPLPPIMLGEGTGPNEEVRQGLETTGFFLRRRLAVQLGNKPLPSARQRFVDRFNAQVNAQE